MKFCLKFVVLFLLLFVTLQKGVSQIQEFNLISKVKIEADHVIGIDKFDNIYYVLNNSIFKKTPENKILAFQDILLGDVANVDILNPNKITVFYKMANTAVILDNRMTEIVRKSFNNISPYRNVGFCGTSKDQGLWIYNIDTNQLELFDYRQNKSLFKTLPVNEEVLELKNNFNFCYLRTENLMMVYNIYGSRVGDIPLTNVNSYSLSENNMIIQHENRLDFYDKNYELIKSEAFEFKDYENLLFTSENLYLYNDNMLSKYSLGQ